MIRKSNFGWAALLVLVLPSCSDSSHTEPEPTASTGGTATGGANASGASASASDGGGGSAGAGGGSAGAGGGSAGANPAAGTPPLPTRVASYLRASSPRLVIEIDAVSALAPYPESSAFVTSWLADVIDKPEGIAVEAGETLAALGSNYDWTFDALNSFAEQHATDDAAGPPRIQVLAVDGRYGGDDGSGTVLGLAWSNRFVALFEDAIRSRCQGGLTGALDQDVCKVAERNVWAHELGHTLGLVDNGIPMVTEHRDPAHGRHDVREGCLMYWAYDGPQVFDTLLARLNSQNQDLDLCEESLQDIEAAK